MYAVLSQKNVGWSSAPQQRSNLPSFIYFLEQRKKVRGESTGYAYIVHNIGRPSCSGFVSKCSTCVWRPYVCTRPSSSCRLNFIIVCVCSWDKGGVRVVVLLLPMDLDFQHTHNIPRGGVVSSLLSPPSGRSFDDGDDMIPRTSPNNLCVPVVLCGSGDKNIVFTLK